MNQPHVILVFRFPEDDAETFMPYTADETEGAIRDARAFLDMYPGVLYVTVFYIDEFAQELERFRWNNPLAAKLTALANSVGDAMRPGLLTSSASATSAGAFFRKLNKAFSDKALASRPPLAEQFASPLPSTLKTFGGRNRRTRRGRRQ